MKNSKDQTDRSFFLWSEIEESRPLRWIGLCLILTHLATFAYWLHHGRFERIVGRLQVPWPFLDGLNFSVRLNWTESSVLVALFLYLGLILITFAVGAVTGKGKVVWGGVLVLTSLKVVLLLQDFRSSGNYHYMPFWVSLVYLFVPQKTRTIRWMIPSFYLIAGFLKLNYEWISGSALFNRSFFEGPLFLYGKLIPVAAIYVVVLELVFSWLLLSRDRRVRWFALVQFGLFHAVSWSIVGFFYPIVMVLLLCCLEFAWLDDDPAPLRSRFSIAVLALLFALQFVPRWIPGDEALTGEGRFVALDMFDARAECDTTLMLTHEGQTILDVVDVPEVGVRFRCDPLLFLSIAREICTKLRDVNDTTRVDLYVSARRSSERIFRPSVTLENVCVQSPVYHVLGGNDWIHR